MRSSPPLAQITSRLRVPTIRSAFGVPTIVIFLPKHSASANSAGTVCEDAGPAASPADDISIGLEAVGEAVPDVSSG